MCYFIQTGKSFSDTDCRGTDCDLAYSCSQDYKPYLTTPILLHIFSHHFHRQKVQVSCSSTLHACSKMSREGEEASNPCCQNQLLQKMAVIC